MLSVQVVEGCRGSGGVSVQVVEGCRGSGGGQVDH